MISLCLCFQVHLPYRLRHYTVFDTTTDYFDEPKNADVCRKIAGKCYLPTSRILLELIKQHEGRFRVAFSITGTALEQLQAYSPETLGIFQKLAETGCVEFVAVPYHHGLSFLFSRGEFAEQVSMHRELIAKLFGQTPASFMNTGLLYSNELAQAIVGMGGFSVILAGCAERVLGLRSPNFVYRTADAEGIKLLLRNTKLSDAISLLFSDRLCKEWPLQPGKFAEWVRAANGNGQVVNLFIDYETFGEHQREETGIFDFLRQMPAEVLKQPDMEFRTPIGVAGAHNPVEAIDALGFAYGDGALSMLLGNAMQKNAIQELHRLEKAVKASADPGILASWRRMQSTDHLLGMCTKWATGSVVGMYFSPYDSPYDAYINFMNVLDNIKVRCEALADAEPGT